MDYSNLISEMIIGSRVSTAWNALKSAGRAAKGFASRHGGKAAKALEVVTVVDTARSFLPKKDKDPTPEPPTKVHVKKSTISKPKKPKKPKKIKSIKHTTPHKSRPKPRKTK